MIILAYSIFAPLQEFLVRGCLQGSLERFLVYKHTALMSIILANLMFGMFHLFISFYVSLVAMIGGFAWGFLYHRHKTLVGISMSHVILGVSAFNIIGFQLGKVV